MATSIELYETLRDRIGEDAARMVAETIPQAENVATKADIAELRGELRTEIHKSALSTVKWILGFTIPMWAATWAAIVGLYFKH